MARSLRTPSSSEEPASLRAMGACEPANPVFQLAHSRGRRLPGPPDPTTSDPSPLKGGREKRPNQKAEVRKLKAVSRKQRAKLASRDTLAPCPTNLSVTSALIAHVDHGKTTLVDGLLRAAGVFADHEKPVERIMDSDDQERERGITILAKAASIVWRGVKINLVDTPGHADFGGEVERALALVDGVLLLVDAAEGPMPQTRYVLSKALALSLPVVVVVNKVDRPDARPAAVVDEIYELFFDLEAREDQIEFPIVSAVARNGISVRGIGMPDDDATLAPILDAIIETIPEPEGDSSAPVQAIVTNLDASDYLGRLAIGRVIRGTLVAGAPIALLQGDGAPPIKRKLGQLMGFVDLGRIDVTQRAAGDLFVVAGFPEVQIGDTFSDPETIEALPRLEVDEPVLTMTFGVNTSPLAGTEGTYLTSRHSRNASTKKCLAMSRSESANTASPEVIEVAGRGELQLAVLIESMRREGYELQVSRPEVIVKVIDGKEHEPLETVTVDVPDDYVGAVTQAIAPRKGRIARLNPGEHGRTIIAFTAPSRGLLGLRSHLMTTTRGTRSRPHAPRRLGAVGRRTPPPTWRCNGRRPSWHLDRLCARQSPEAWRDVHRCGC